MSDVFDLVILGGGCAGLSLSMALEAHGGRTPRTLVIESRTEYWNDRTWCYWSDRSTLAPYEIQHCWQTMRVSHGGQSVSLDCGSTPYHMLAGEYFYAAAQSSIDQQPNITLRLGTSVISEPSYAEGLWTIDTSAGNVTARAVVDTRPPVVSADCGGATLWQSFYGLEIECKAAVFDPSLLDLMNFLDPDPRHVPFVYVLPVTPTRALVELTVFGATPLGRRDLSAQLEAAVAKLVGDAPYETLRSEHGILPMGLNETPPSQHRSYARVGVMAGSARPSTGYAFQRIQLWARECALSLASHGHPTPHRPDSLPLRVMDRIFLEVLRADPIRGGAIFFSLFGGADPARVIRFLSGRGGVVDSLAVVAAMPFAPFLQAAFAIMWRTGRMGRVEKVA
jgi:lycopene beta-cyclase